MDYILSGRTLHFHAKYAEFTAQIYLSDLSIKEGQLPKRAYRLVKEWAQNNKEELLEMYDSKNIHKLKPLE